MKSSKALAQPVSATPTLRFSALLRDAGDQEERTVAWEELLAADELFASGNYGKVSPITRIDRRDLQPGPVYTRARQLYWDFAQGRL